VGRGFFFTCVDSSNVSLPVYGVDSSIAWLFSRHKQDHDNGWPKLRRIVSLTVVCSRNILIKIKLSPNGYFGSSFTPTCSAEWLQVVGALS
jgi:hypothetical protein